MNPEEKVREKKFDKTGKVDILNNYHRIAERSCGSQLLGTQKTHSVLLVDDAENVATKKITAIC
jgi:hypothetical protein